MPKGIPDSCRESACLFILVLGDSISYWESIFFLLTSFTIVRSCLSGREEKYITKRLLSYTSLTRLTPDFP